MSKKAAKEIQTEIVHETPTLSKGLRKKLDSAPVQVTGTWDGARDWLDRARRAQEIVLYCQVMVGFELLALRESLGETRGRPKLGVEPQASFVDTAAAETGLGRRTVFKLMVMAEAVVPKLRQHSSLLRGFDPFANPIAALPAPQKEALSSAVHKLTDGLTQADFLVGLGLAKAPQGSATTGGYRGRKPPASLSDQIAVNQHLAREDWDLIEKSLNTSGTRFLLLEDTEVRQQIDVLDAHLKARKAWVSAPKEKRKPADIEAILTAVQRPFVPA